MKRIHWVLAFVFAAEIAALTTGSTAPVPEPIKSGYTCVRPVYTENWVSRGGSPVIERSWAGYLPCKDVPGESDA